MNIVVMHVVRADGDLPREGKQDAKVIQFCVCVWGGGRSG